MLTASWETLGQTLTVGILAYIALIVLLRLSGKRTLSKWNAFDFVVTIAIGSTLATVLLSQTTPLLQGVIALGLLIYLQFLITWVAVRFPRVQRWVKAQPTLLLFRGRLLPEALLRERVTESEVRAALRSQGVAALETVDAVVLETDGSFSVIEQLEAGADWTLQDVYGYSRAVEDAQAGAS